MCQSATTYISSAVPQSIKENNDVLDEDDTDLDDGNDNIFDMQEPPPLYRRGDDKDFNVDDDVNEDTEEADDNMNNFVLTSLDPDVDFDEGEDIGNNNNCRATFDEDDIDNIVNTLPTTNAGDLAFPIDHETEYSGTFGNIKIAGSVFLNQCGTLLTRKKYQIKGSSRHHFVLQKMVATCDGKCIPLMYPEGVLFPSIHWSMACDMCSILGCIPAPLLTDEVRSIKFASIHSHIRSRLTNPCCATSTDPRYIAHCYDILTNLTANHEDTRLILNRGLAVDHNTGEIGLRGKGDTALLESVDNKQMVRNLCFSQKYFPWDHFLMYICNQKNHFGTAPIKNWIDDGE